MTIRKPVNELTAADLERFPVWVYALDEEGVDGQDETTVRPYRVQAPLDGSCATYIVRAKFKLKNGRAFIGSVYARPRSARAVEDVQPVILTSNGSVIFWHGAMRPKKGELKIAYDALGVRGFDEAFPIEYRSDPAVAIAGGAISGHLTGFMCFRSGSFKKVEALR